MYIATHIFTYLPICLSMYLSTCSSIYLSIYLPAGLCSEFFQCDRVDHVLWILYLVCGHLLGLLRGIGRSQEPVCTEQHKQTLGYVCCSDCDFCVCSDELPLLSL